MKRLTLLVVLLLAGCGGQTVESQVKQIEVCKKAGLDYSIGKNDLGWVVSIDCAKPEKEKNHD